MLSRYISDTDHQVAHSTSDVTRLASKNRNSASTPKKIFLEFGPLSFSNGKILCRSKYIFRFWAFTNTNTRSRETCAHSLFGMLSDGFWMVFKSQNHSSAVSCFAHSARFGVSNQLSTGRTSSKKNHSRDENSRLVFSFHRLSRINHRNEKFLLHLGYWNESINRKFSVMGFQSSFFFNAL